MFYKILTSLPNWACSACGMASGRKESVFRHINNPRIHNKKARPMPYIDYVACLQSGIFAPSIAHLFRSRKKLINSPFIEKESILDKIQKRVDEKYVEGIVDRIVAPYEHIPWMHPCITETPHKRGDSPTT